MSTQSWGYEEIPESDAMLDEPLELDGFLSDDGQHHVVWQLAEVSKDEEWEAWWCLDHQKLYYGGCLK